MPKLEAKIAKPALRVIPIIASATISTILSPVSVVQVVTKVLLAALGKL